MNLTHYIAILNYLREASTTLSYRYTLAERSRSQYSHQLFRIAILTMTGLAYN